MKKAGRFFVGEGKSPPFYNICKAGLKAAIFRVGIVCEDTRSHGGGDLVSFYRQNNPAQRSTRHALDSFYHEPPAEAVSQRIRPGSYGSTRSSFFGSILSAKPCWPDARHGIEPV